MADGSAERRTLVGPRAARSVASTGSRCRPADSFRTLKRITVAVTVFASVLAPVAHAAFPGGNGELAWSSAHGLSCDSYPCRGGPEIKAVGRMSGRRRVLACNALNPRYSPDGRRIVFQRQLVGIFTKRVDRRSRATLVRGTENSYGATWAPDGRLIAFGVIPPRGDVRADIYTARVDGTRRRRITFDGGSYGPVWGPDGRIAFGWQGRRPGVFVINPRGGGRSRVTLTPHPQYRGSGGTVELVHSWSPDGKRIAFTRHRRDGRDRVYVVSADGSGLHRVAAGFAFAAWSPDGKRIAIAHRQFNRRINTVRPDGTERRLLTADSRDGSARCHYAHPLDVTDQVGFSGLDWQPLRIGR
jgi:WD40-like Beta Propeller Repeat